MKINTLYYHPCIIVIKTSSVFNSGHDHINNNNLYNFHYIADSEMLGILTICGAALSSDQITLLPFYHKENLNFVNTYSVPA